MKNILQTILIFLVSISFYSCKKEDEETLIKEDNTLKEYTATLLLPPLSGNTSETFFSTRNGKKYSFTTAATGSNSDSVDFGYFYSSNFGASFMSPSNYATSTEWDAIFASWKTKNQTTFKTVDDKTYNLNYFESISLKEQLDYIYNNGKNIAAVGGTGIAGQRIGNLIEGQLFIINTSNNKKSLIYIVSITPGNGSVGKITIRSKTER